jgi:NAD(P)-dependent dehydrogenase (short-subunit alcohol dehydrogenase family)
MGFRSTSHKGFMDAPKTISAGRVHGETLSTGASPQMNLHVAPETNPWQRINCEVQSIGTALQEIRTALAFEVLLSPDTQSLNQWDQAAAVSTEAVAHLASDDARWVNGQTLRVNGGIL